MIKKLLLFAGLINSFHSAQAQFSKYSNEFMAIGVSARGLAMSGSQVASVDDVTSGYWNPAGLIAIEDGMQISAMHSEYFAGIANYDYASVAAPIGYGDKYVGLSLIRFGVDDIPNTLFLVEPDGSINYDNITSFSAIDFAALFSYAQKTGIDGLRIGGNAKLIRRSVGDFAGSWGAGIDIGVQFDYGNLKLGAVAKDVTTTFNAWSFNFTEAQQQIFINTGNEVPTNSIELTAPRVVVGGAYYFQLGNNFSVLPELDCDITTDGKRNVIATAGPFSFDPHMGVEGGYKQSVFLRAGIGNIQKTFDDATNQKQTSLQPNVGVGLNFKNVRIDYALTDLGNLSESLYSNVFSLRITLNKKG